MTTPKEHEEDFTLPESESSAIAAPIMVIDGVTNDESAKPEEVQNAFGAAPFFWKEKELAPFAIDREGDWLRHREMLEDAPLDEVIRKPFAMVPDALRLLWFLSHEPNDWLGIPGMKEVETEDGGTRWIRLTGKDRAIELETRIRAWANENVTHSEATMAVGMFYDIYNRAQTTRAIAKPSERHDAQKSKN
jgi:hypothetical protein